MQLSSSEGAAKVWPAQAPDAGTLRSISFDLDGTFADTSGDLAGALNALRVEFGQPPLPVPEVARHVGRGARWLVSNCLEDSSVGDLETKVLRFLELYAACCTDTTAAYAGLDGLALSLRRRGLSVALATNKPRRFTEVIVDHLGWSGLFNSLHCGDDGPAKPDPHMLRVCMQNLASEPGQHLHVGDTPVDALSAQRAGCFFAPCLWGMDAGAALTDMGLVGFAEPADLIAAFEEG